MRRVLVITLLLGIAAPAQETLSPRERNRRGDKMLKAGRFAEAIADFDAYIAARPEVEPYHWQRGIAYYYAGRYKDGVRQFEMHRKVNSDDVENAVWHFLCKAKLDGVEAATRALLPVGPDSRIPMMTVYELFGGRATIADVERKAKAASSRQAESALFYAHLYIALYQEAMGKVEAARHHMKVASETHTSPHYMGDIARMHAGLMKKQAAPRPNILFIMSDDHCARAIGAYGSRLAGLDPTPAIDRLAAEGVMFTNVFCTNSICTPSRASILTGQYGQRNGVLDLYDVLSADKHHLSREMKAAGYTTAVIGKWHLKHDPRHFDYYCVLPGQGRYFNPIMYTNRGGTKRKVRFDSTLTREVPVRQFTGHSSDVITDATIEWLESRDTSKPFFLMHHYKAPHDMFKFAPRYGKYLEGVEIPEPGNMYDQPGPHFGSIATRGKNDGLVNVIGSSISRRGRRNYGGYYKLGKDLSDREFTHQSYQRYARDYLRCVKGVDDNVARLLAYLGDNDLMDNTVIIYTGDQGMMLGEHDYMDKRWMYEESMRMPLIVRYPGRIKAGSRSDWLINNTDFAPTILELAGRPTPAYMQGRSFEAALGGSGEPTTWRKGTYYRYWMHMAHGHNNPAHFGIRTKKHKLIFFYGADFTDVHGGKKVSRHGGNRYWKNTPAAWEFYDLTIDRHEMRNRYGDPKYREVIADLKGELRAMRKRLGETDARYPRLEEIIAAHWDE